MYIIIIIGKKKCQVLANKKILHAVAFETLVYTHTAPKVVFILSRGSCSARSEAQWSQTSPDVSNSQWEEGVTLDSLCQMCFECFLMLTTHTHTHHTAPCWLLMKNEVFIYCAGASAYPCKRQKWESLCASIFCFYFYFIFIGICIRVACIWRPWNKDTGQEKKRK